jgi:hypothetical protein
MIGHPFRRRLAELILAGAPFTADDLTASGSMAIDIDHGPNGAQSGIGSLFQQASRSGLIEWTGGAERSRAPHRKGGMVRVWIATPRGRIWADALVDESRRRHPSNGVSS